ncbi:MAG: hypothetical protein FJ279_29875, partial [Planctomycetes bacterium]|nr:hypothetical protein [Planctomycetota bacterium]
LTGISDAEAPPQTIFVSAESDNTVLIPNPTVTYTSPNATGSLSYTPVANQSGTAVITVWVGDTMSAGYRQFTVTVNPVNDAPTLDALSNVTIAAGSGTQTKALTGISAGPNETQPITITAVSNSPGLIPNPTVTYTSPEAAGSLSYAPMAGQSGDALITVTARDAGLDGVPGTADDGTVQQTFTVTVLDTLTPTPTGVDLLPASDTGASNADDLTKLDNSAPDRTLQFEVAGTVPGATVTLYSDGVEIGSAIASGTATIVATNGAVDLADGPRSITARQSQPGQEASGDSPGLTVTVDAAAPRVTDMTPAPGLSRGTVAAVTVTFSESVAQATVTGATFTVSSAPGSDGLWGTSDDTFVTGAVSCDPATRTALFTPQAALLDGEYAAWLDGAASVADPAGNVLDGEFGGTFPSGNGEPSGSFLAPFTLDNTGPRVAAISPDVVSFNTEVASVVVTFSEDIAAGTLTADAFKVSSHRGADATWGTGDDTYVPGALSYDAATRQATFTPAQALTYGHYGVWLDGGPNGITDGAGNPLDGEGDYLLPLPVDALPSGAGGAGGGFVTEFDLGLTLGTGGVRRTQYSDADSDLFQLDYRGAGSARVTFGERADLALGADIHAITFAGAGRTTRLTSRLVQLSPTGAGRTTIQTIDATGQALGALDLTLAGPRLGASNQTNILGDVVIGGALTKLAVGGDLEGDAQIAGKSTTFTVNGDVRGNVQIGGNSTTFKVGGDVLGDVDIRGTARTVTVGGQLNARFT